MNQFAVTATTVCLPGLFFGKMIVWLCLENLLAVLVKKTGKTRPFHTRIQTEGPGHAG